MTKAVQKASISVDACVAPFCFFETERGGPDQGIGAATFKTGEGTTTAPQEGGSGAPGLTKGLHTQQAKVLVRSWMHALLQARPAAVPRRVNKAITHHEHASCRMLVKQLPKIWSGEGAAEAQPQDESQATSAPKLRKEDAVLDFNKPAAVLAHQVC